MKIAIVGGGAAGFFAAFSVKDHHPESQVTIFEKSDKLLSKVKISGGGRCNVTHACFQVSQLSKYAKQIGLNVRGVMGYEGHLMFTESRDDRRDGVEISMSVLQEAHSITGGEVISAGGTGTFDLNSFATEIQAGSFLFMDTRYASLDLPFLESLWVVSKVISVEKDRRRAVCDAGVKSFSMDYGKPSLEDCVIGFCSDEHTVILPKEKDGTINFKVGDLVQLRTSHVDPTVAKHPKLFGVIDGLVHEEWKVDLRDW